jgi:hypothetical protein
MSLSAWKNLSYEALDSTGWCVVHTRQQDGSLQKFENDDSGVAAKCYVAIGMVPLFLISERYFLTAIDIAGSFSANHGPVR